MGRRVTLWFSGAFGLEGGFAFAPSDVDYDLLVEGGAMDGSASRGVSASVWRGNVKALLNLAPSPDAAMSFLIGGGLAVVGRSGDAYKEFVIQYLGEDLVFENEGTTDIGGVLNLGVMLDVSEGIDSNRRRVLHPLGEADFDARRQHVRARVEAAERSVADGRRRDAAGWLTRDHDNMPLEVV